MKLFEQLGLSFEALKVLEQKGFETPTEIQKQAIPVILTTDKDIVAQAQTGTGKTAAFGLPILEIMDPKAGQIQALILTPTRELAIQVTEEISSFRGNKRFNIVPIYGGQSIDLQFRKLKKGADIVVGTPGRVIDHLKRKTLNFKNIKFLVFDEADEMLNMGFLEDVETIIQQTGDKKRVLLFSATMPDEIKKIAQKYMKDSISIKVASKQLTAAQTDQIYFEVRQNDKFEALCRIIDMEDDFYGLVFCRTKVDVDKISTHLIERGYDAEGLHGDISQNMRERTLSKFKEKRITILVATDVAARGIDVQNLTHVINFALPQDPEAYVHRVGRTGRAGKEGIAITFVTPSEYRKLQHIQRKVKTDIRKESLPTAKAVVEVKKQRIRQQLDDLVTSGKNEACEQMADDLLNTYAADDILAALLQCAFGDELDVKNYADINKTNVDRQGKTRLFIKIGKKDSYTKKKLVELIEKNCKIPANNIRDVQVLDIFSFVTLPFQDAEAVLNYFKKNSKQNVVVRKAKEKS